MKSVFMAVLLWKKSASAGLDSLRKKQCQATLKLTHTGGNMPYKTTASLPDNVKNVLPAHAQEIYQAAFNSAWDEYKDKKQRHDDESREEVAHKVAWAAVKNKYEKGDDDKWHPKK